MWDDREEDLYCWTTIVKGPSRAAIACMNHRGRATRHGRKDVQRVCGYFDLILLLRYVVAQVKRPTELEELQYLLECIMQQ